MKKMPNDELLKLIATQLYEFNLIKHFILFAIIDRQIKINSNKIHHSKPFKFSQLQRQGIKANKKEWIPIRIVAMKTEIILHSHSRLYWDDDRTINAVQATYTATNHKFVSRKYPSFQRPKIERVRHTHIYIYSHARNHPWFSYSHRA